MEIPTEAIPELKVALKRYRLAAALIDFCILCLAGFAIAFFFVERQNFYTESGSGYFIGFASFRFPALLFLMAWFVLFPLSEGLKGQTIGKRIFKLKVVKQDMSPVSFGTSLLRHLFDGIDLILLVGFILASTNSRSQRIGDFIAKTVVIMKE